jgi:lysophospholipase L1-like esterase
MKYILPLLLLFLFLGTSAQNLKLKEPVKYLALGDSYTIGESVFENGRYPVQLMDSLEARGYGTASLKVIATTGWRTDDLKAAILQEDPPKDYNLVSLLIGVNDQYQGYDTEWYEPRFTELLEMAIEFAGGDKSSVFVVSIPDYAYTPFGQQSNPAAITEDIDSFNAINREVTEELNVTYINITPISRQGLEKTELVASDGLHPSSIMYSQWVELILNELITPDLASSTKSPDEMDGIKVYPNPFTDTIEFEIEEKNVGEVEMTIHNTEGKLVKHLIFRNSSRIIIDTSEFQPGIYFYNLMTDKADCKGKLIKIRSATSDR